MNKLTRLVFSLAASCLLYSSLGLAEEVQVTITTRAPDSGVFLTPFWIGFHDGGFDSYDRGAAVSAGLERLVEDGNTAPFSDEFAAAAALGEQATLPGAAGPIFAGETVSRIFELDPELHRYFSYASMVIPSNDAFIANGNPLAHRVFDPNGNFTPTTFYVLGNETLDGGTEVNDELESSTAALGQAAPDTGTDENGVVTLHPGFNDGGRILTARPNGDFTAPGYVLAEITIERAPRTEIRFSGSGAQEVPPVATDATAACSAVLNSAQDALTVSCVHDVAAVAAHVHEAASGENGPVAFGFADPTSPISETFPVSSEQVDTLLAGGFYVNLHSAANPAGEVRAQIDGCFEGPEGLCLQTGERFQVSATWTAAGDGGTGSAERLSNDAGQFSFFDEENIELVVKVLDGCSVNGTFWTFIAGATDVGVEVTVTDTLANETRTYTNAEGNPFELVRDIEAFATCP